MINLNVPSFTVYLDGEDIPKPSQKHFDKNIQTPTSKHEYLECLPFCFLHADFFENTTRPRKHLYLSTF